MASADVHGTATVEVERALGVGSSRLWDLLTSPTAAPVWLGVEAVAAGASIAADRGGADPGSIVAVGDVELTIRFDGGSVASISVTPVGARSSRLVVSEQDVATDRRDAVARWWSDVLSAAAYVADVASRHADPAQAVLIVHGIGEQRPGSTIRGFAKALLGDEEYLSKPDWFSESYELRRLQAFRNEQRPRTDFFELYWAHQIRDTRVGQVLAWLRSLLRRRPSTVPDQLRWVYRLLWASVGLLVLGLVLLGVGQVASFYDDASSTVKRLPLAGIALGAIGSAVSGFLVGSLGDAARYLSAKPDNVAVRQLMRTQGVELLRRLHESGRYHRIVVVGHSLGSVIAYDVLTAYWADVHASSPRRVAGSQDALEAFEALAVAGASVETLQSAQRLLWAEMRSMGHPWLVTDFVSCGSPLTHAQLLLAADATELATKRRQRELPVCPPQPDIGTSTPGTTGLPPVRYSFEREVLVDGRPTRTRVLHHGAVFGPTRWTNLYFPVRWGLGGDPVGGPVASPFAPVPNEPQHPESEATPASPGVRDLEVWTASWWRRRTPKAHSCYWRAGSDSDREAVMAVRAAVDLDAREWLRELAADLPLSWWLPSDRTWW